MVVDTRSCLADFRTNSFVGTEGKSIMQPEDVYADRYVWLVRRIYLS